MRFLNAVAGILLLALLANPLVKLITMAENTIPGQNNESPRARTSKRGFASMDPSKQREIASKGGKAAHMQGVAHEWTPNEAREAGRKGGEAVSKNKKHMSDIGRKGGEASRSSVRESGFGD